MKAIIVLLAIVHGCMCASLTRDTSCLRICPANFDPVCGSDGHTYSNLCALESANCADASIKLIKTGDCAPVRRACPPTICITLWSPVCGSDGKTYSNKCVFQAANCNHDLYIVHEGTC